MNRLSPVDIFVLNFVGLPPLINAPSNWYSMIDFGSNFDAFS